MKEERVTADAASRLDQFLARRFPGYSRTYLKGLIERGCVSVAGIPRAPDFRLAGGESVLIRWPQARWPELDAFEGWVLHEDKDILVLDKPSGLLVHPLGESWLSRPQAALAEEEANLAGLLHELRPALRAGVQRLGIVHRLDRQTSGVMLVAKTPAAQQALLSAFRERTVHKIYRAIVLGEIGKVRVEAPVGRLPGRRRVAVTPLGKEAMTGFKAVKSAGGLSLVAAEPLTGRTHQIRAHLAHLGHPVLGDPDWFGDKEAARLDALGAPRPPRMLLHAWRIRFTHPKGRPADFTAPLPRDFREYWKSAAG